MFLHTQWWVPRCQHPILELGIIACIVHQRSDIPASTGTVRARKLLVHAKCGRTIHEYRGIVIVQAVTLHADYDITFGVLAVADGAFGDVRIDAVIDDPRRA
jgi:hypothetical protein